MNRHYPVIPSMAGATKKALPEEGPKSWFEGLDADAAVEADGRQVFAEEDRRPGFGVRPVVGEGEGVLGAPVDEVEPALRRVGEGRADRRPLAGCLVGGNLAARLLDPR